MELVRITGIQPVCPVAARGSANDVKPAFAIESSERMEDDSYGEQSGNLKRGMEDEEAGSRPEDSEVAPEEGPPDPDGKVNLFA